MRAIRRFLPALLVAILAARTSSAYSVLAHEAIIDDSWPKVIRPLLLERFPDATEDQLREAHAYAYGGAIIQDMGYYPFGSKFFTDLTHYVRSGDFVLAMIHSSRDLDEYAFALGSAAHYSADDEGHRIAINRTVPIMYPKLRRRFGNDVTYEDNPAAHLKMEFAFDVVQVARGQYKPQAYHDFIGFKVSKQVLERAFEDTYSLQMDQIFKNVDRALGTYRFAVSSVIPEMTKTAWASKKDQIQKLQHGVNRRDFVYRMTRVSYEKEWDRHYDRPGIGARFLAWLIRILPKVGPLKALAFKVPTPEAEKDFLTSLDDAEKYYASLLADADANQPQFRDINFDTGEPVRCGDYHLADQTYDKLLETLREKDVQPSSALRADILRFYASCPANAQANSSLRSSVVSGEPRSVKARAEFEALREDAH